MILNLKLTEGICSFMEDNADSSDTKLPPEQTCPIPNTHRRLQEAHQLWHQTADNYQDPTGFRTNLNATIQTVRNVTFILQKEKHSIPDFETWYPEWQERMRQDPVLRWLHQARNIIVKEGDLKTKSTARVTIQTYLDFPVTDLEVPPLLPTEIIAIHLSNLSLPNLPPSVLETGILSVERRWVVSELPEWELLDVIAHGYGVLSNLLAEAHKQCGYSFSVCKGLHSKNASFVRNSHLDGKLPCMVTNRELRTAHVSLSNKQPLIPGRKEEPVDLTLVEKASKRYGFKDESPPDLLKDKSLVEVVEWCLVRAKQILLKDKYHVPMAFLQLPDGSWQFNTFVIQDQEDKYVLMRQLANEIERTGAEALIDIHEVWYAPADATLEKGLSASQSPDRREALAITSATAKGEIKSYITPFSRGFFGKITFESTQIMENDQPFYLEPVLAVWRRWKSGTK